VKRDGPALALAMTFPAFMAWLYFVVLASDGGAPNNALRLAFAFGKTLQFAFPALFVMLVDRLRLRVALPGTRGLALGLSSGIVVGAGILGIYHLWLRESPLAAAAPEKVFRKLQEFNCSTPARFVALALFISVFHSLLEEYYWRWFVFGRLRRHLPFARALVLASLSFMAHHVIVLGVYFPGSFWTLALPLSLGVAVGGAFWAWLYERSQSLAAAWVSHLLIDVAIMVVGFDMVTPYWMAQ
jgi:membrane protease YdiL (CAAX protease family)